MNMKLATACKTKAMTRNEGNDVKIHLIYKERMQLHCLLSELGLKSSLIETVFLLIDAAEGKVYFEPTYDELAEVFFLGVADNPKEKRRRRTVIRGRIRSVKKWQNKNESVFFEILDIKPDGFSGAKNRPKPYLLECDLVFMKRLLNIRGAEPKDFKTVVGMLKNEYSSKT